MGGNYYDWKPIHPVTLSSFWLGKYPVTFEEYDRFCDATDREKPDDEGWGLGRRPVINVSWDDAQGYCQWLSRQTGKTYRLPTEAEWEFAARGGILSKGFQYAGSNDLGEVAWHKKNSGKKSQLVGEKKPNELGLHDMSGNVSEWCGDWYEDYSTGTQTNPKGPTKGTERVFRSGS